MLFVLHYQNDKLTDQCVQSLVQSAAGQTRVIVIDNGSEVPYIPLYDCEVFRLEANVHLIPAFNMAMQTHPDWFYACFNDDVIASPTLIERMLGALENAEIGIAAPGTSDHEAGGLYVPAPGDYPNLEMKHCDNHAIFYAGEMVDEIGWPTSEGNPNRSNWYSNREYCHRARQAGYKVVGVRSAYVTHLHLGGYNAEADRVGLAWFKERMGDQWQEAL